MPYPGISWLLEDCRFGNGSMRVRGRIQQKNVQAPKESYSSLQPHQWPHLSKHSKWKVFLFQTSSRGRISATYLFVYDTVTIESTTLFGDNSTMHPITSNPEEPSSLIPNETSCSKARVILPQEKKPTTLNKKVGWTYRRLQESVGILTTKINATAGNITTVTALQCFKSRLILCKSEEQLLSALNNIWFS